MKRIALVFDSPGWAFWNIANQIKRHSPDWDCTMVAYPTIAPDGLKDFDCTIQCGYHGIAQVLDGHPKALVSSVADHIYWQQKRAHDRIELAAKHGLVTALNYRMRDELIAKYGPVIWGTTQDGVDVRMFCPDAQQPQNRQPVVGWCGNSVWEGKGLPMIREACKNVGVELRVRDVLDRTNTPHDEMPAWYRGLDLYVCASLAEGTPNPILEAMACGIPVLTTDVGIVPELLAQGARGVVIFERTQEALEERLRYWIFRREELRALGQEARLAIIRGRWGWQHRVLNYRLAAEAAMESYAARQAPIPEANATVEVIEPIVTAPVVAEERPIKHLFIIYSVGIGGVERAVFDWLTTLPLVVRQRIAIATIVDANEHGTIPMPEGVRYIGKFDRSSAYFDNLSTLWIQPLTGNHIELVVEAVRLGIKVRWLVVSTSEVLLQQSRALNGKVDFIATSKWLADVCRKNEIAPIHILPHFVLGAVAPVTGKVMGKRLGYVGRESTEKNCDKLPLLLSHLPSGFSLHYYVPQKLAPLATYSVPIHKRTLALIETLGLEERVTWHFDITDREIIYNGFDILLLPSWYEGYSLVAHEALVHGIPVVCSDGLPVTTEKNPGVVPFALRSDTKNPEERVLNEAGIAAAIKAIARARTRDRTAIQDAASVHSELSFRSVHLPTLISLLGETNA